MNSAISEKNREKLLRIVDTGFEITRGSPLPLGATVKRSGINFAVFSRHAAVVTLVIFFPEEAEPIIEFPLDPRYNRTGDIWHALIKGLDPLITYGFRMDDQSTDHHKKTQPYNYDTILIDPYAKALTGNNQWGITDGVFSNKKGKHQRHWRSVVIDDDFDWEFDQPLNKHLADSIIYEIHVRGFTQHPSSEVNYPGTYKGIEEKIPYLKKLGITALELMPVTEFDETDNPRVNPETGTPLLNFWGYHPLCFFAPKVAYASDKAIDGAIREFKSMVKSLHKAGIEVILDMVFNHTAEGDKYQQTTSFRGLDNRVYYIIDPVSGEYLNYSGCGNTVNCNHPVVRDMILDCLCYWVTEMHVDGFRFDLASIMGRGRDGEVLANPPLLERIAANPVLSNSKLIAEAWDAAGLYQVGDFPNWGRWAEWNGKFRDDIRCFVKGDPDKISTLASRLTGSAELYQESLREPFHSVNFITSHDGFTLYDLVSYQCKHNDANGENGADGDNKNLGWNCGAEGTVASEEIHTLRRRQIKNMATIMMLSWGTPMILGGDEIGRTQQGNNNAYCQDNEISWIDWRLPDQNQEIFRFFQQLIKFRKKHSVFRRRHFIDETPGASVKLTWHGFKNNQPDWSHDSWSLGLCFSGSGCPNEIFIIANSHWAPHAFELPPVVDGKKWRRFLDTSLNPPFDISPLDEEPQTDDQTVYAVGSRSVVVLIAK